MNLNQLFELVDRAGDGPELTQASLERWADNILPSLAAVNQLFPFENTGLPNLDQPVQGAVSLHEAGRVVVDAVNSDSKTEKDEQIKAAELAWMLADPIATQKEHILTIGDGS